MKLSKQIIYILIVFFKTETLFSDNNTFNVNNIQLEKKDKITNSALANQAIKKGFDQLISKILLKQDKAKLADLNFSSIKELVTYYQVADISDKKQKKNWVNFNVTFDKDKIHDLFYKKAILYSEITDKELYILPVLIKENIIFVFNNNFFYENWSLESENDLIEYILPLENIEIIQNINNNKNNLLNLNVKNLFKEYPNKNIALILIEDNKNGGEKVYIKTLIQNKNISKSLNIKKINLATDKKYNQIITATKEELVNLVKLENMIDIRTPSFLNVKLDLDKKSNFVELNSRIKNVDVVENIFVQEFNKNYMKLRIKYLGKLDKIINQFKKENIDLKLINEDWVIKAL